MKTLKDLKVGDIITRHFGGTDGVDMKLKVSYIDDGTIQCGAWVFDKETGAEIDEDLGWGPLTGTGSYIVVEDE